jgi:hypothetical protein
VTKTSSHVGRRDIDNVFFELYSETKALSSPSRRTGQTIKFFHDSRQRLQHELKIAYNVDSKDELNLTGLAARHSLLALIHLLYPNYIGYNRLSNARQMYQHAVAACSASRSKSSLPYAIGLMIQLRITPFLIKSRKSPQSNLARMRDVAVKFVAKNKSNLELSGYAGLVADGLGSSYFLLERDPKAARTHLKQALSLLTEWQAHTSKSRSGRTSLTYAKERMSFFRAILATAHWDYGICVQIESENTKGDQTEDFMLEARTHYQLAYDYAKRTPWHIYKAMSAHNLAGTFAEEAITKLERKAMIECLRKAVDLGEESLKWFSLWSSYEADFLGGSWIATFYQELAKYSEPKKRRRLMTRSLNLAKKAEQLVRNPKIGLARYNLVNLGDIFYHNSEYYLQLSRQLENETRTADEKIVETLNKSLENCIKSRAYYRNKAFRNRMLDALLLAGDISYEIMGLERSPSERTEHAKTSKRYFSQAIKLAKGSGWNEKVAESCWRMAQVFDREGNFGQSASRYLMAHESYKNVQGIQGNPSVYKSPSDYMMAWNQIERAKLAHRAAEFDKAASLYSEAANLIARTGRWQPRSYLYVAESLIEKSEMESLGENTQEAIRHFVDAVQALTKLQSELENDASEDSKSFIDLARKMTSFCNARIILEKSKESYRIGETEQSMRGLLRAEEMFAELAKNSEDSDSLGSNELSSLASLCKALRSFQLAQISGNPKTYMDAKETFARAAEASKSKTLKPLLAGLSSFATFLYFSKEIEESLDKVLDVEKLVECNKALDSAQLLFRKLGNRSFLNMLRASQHILDATMKMNAAEREIENASVKARLYTQAQRSLTRASKYYELLGSSARVKEALRMIGAVRNHQKLIPLAHDIIAEIASNQIIYTAISSTTLFDQSPENSARDLDSAFVVLEVNVLEPSIMSNQSAKIEFVMSNIGKEEAITVRIDGPIPDEFEIVDNPGIKMGQQSMELTSRIGAGATSKIMITVKPKTHGEFVWHPALVYLDNNREFKITRSQTSRIVVEPDNLWNVTTALADKEKLEQELKLAEDSLQETDNERTRERVYAIKEKISKIEENIFRLKNDYNKMKQQLDQVRSDKSILEKQQGQAAEEEVERLANEDKLLTERIERRRSILEQAHLL